MLSYLSDAKQRTVNKKFKRLTRSLKLQTVYENEKLDTILTQVNASKIHDRQYGINR